MSAIAEVFDAQWSNDVLGQLKSMRENSALCDVMLVGSQGKQFLVHSSVLAASSDYFKELLSERITPTFVLKTDVADNLWPSLIEYLYSGQTELAANKLSDLKEIAEQFQMERVTRALLESENEQAKSLLLEDNPAAQNYMDGMFPERTENGEILCGKTGDYVPGDEDDELDTEDEEEMLLHDFADDELDNEKHSMEDDNNETDVEKQDMGDGNNEEDNEGLEQDEELVNEEETDGPKFRCNACGVYLRTERALKLHNSRKHVQPKGDYLCSICSKMFNNKHTFRMHELRHAPGGGPFKCTECNKGYTSKTLLESHMAKHTGLRPFSCERCGLSYRHRGTLATHQLNCMGRDEHGHRLSKPIFQCTQCGRTLLTQKGLQLHEMIHRGERPVVCTVCGATFRKSNNLILHQRVHTGVRPYVCSVCNKGFVNSSNLKRHFMVHTGEKPFRCEQCPASFNQKHVLIAHVRSKHVEHGLYMKRDAVLGTGAPLPWEERDMMLSSQPDGNTLVMAEVSADALLNSFPDLSTLTQVSTASGTGHYIAIVMPSMQGPDANLLPVKTEESDDVGEDTNESFTE